MRFLLITATLLLGACGSLPEEGARTLNPDTYTVVETTVAPPPAPVVSDPTENVAAVVYLIRGEGLLSRGRVVEDIVTLDQSLTFLIDGPTAEETALGYRSGLTNRPDLLLGSRIDQGIAYIDVSDELDTFSGDEQILIIGQIVLTSLTVPGIAAVQFLRADQPLSVIAPNGNSLTGPIVRSDFATLLAR